MIPTLGLLSAVIRWTLSWNTCSQLWGDRLAMKDKQNNKTTTTHKEEVPCKLFKITSAIGCRHRAQAFTRRSMMNLSILDENR